MDELFRTKSAQEFGARAASGAAELAPHAEGERAAALRMLRNLEASKERLEREAQREASEARGKLAAEVFPVLDNLDRILRAAASSPDRALLEGVAMARSQLEAVLHGFGVERVEADGVRFDPALHEAICLTEVSDPAQHGLVLAQLEPGYLHRGKLLRPAKVNVGKWVAPRF